LSERASWDNIPSKKAGVYKDTDRLGGGLILSILLLVRNPIYPLGSLQVTCPG